MKTKTIFENIKLFIDEFINPGLAMHGGHMAASKFEDGILYVTLSGGCQGCAASKETLQDQIKVCLIEEFPDMTDLVDMTDHSKAQNPYFGE